MVTGLIAGVLLLPVADRGPGVPPLVPPGTVARKDALARYGAATWQARLDRRLTAAWELERAAAADPGATEPLKELVRVYAQLGREPDAIRVARTVLERDPDDAGTAHALARLLLDAGELTEAVAVAKTAAEIVDPATRPDRAVAIYRDLAALLDTAGDPAAAAVQLRKVVELLTAGRAAVLATGTLTPKEIDADIADSSERLGKVLVAAREPDEAAAAFRVAHALYADPLKVNDPNAAARLDWNLSAARAATDPVAALAHLESFLKFRPQAVEPYERLASLLTATGRGADAATVLQKYAARDPKNLPLLAVLAAELARGPDTHAAAEAAFAEVSAATNDPQVLRVVVRSRVDSGRARVIVAEVDRAYLLLQPNAEPVGGGRAGFAAEKVRVLADLLRADPAWANAVVRAAADDLRDGTVRTPQTWHLLGSVAARHNKLELAAVQLRQAVRVAPEATEAGAYGELIGVLRRLRKPAEVAEVCRDGLRNSKISAAFFNYHLSYAAAELGDAAEAVASADKAIAQAGDVNRLTMRLRKVAVLTRLGRWADAVAFCQKLPDEFDDPADRLKIRYTLAGAYWGAKKPAEAEAELRAILDADPDHAGACNDLGYHLAEQGRNLDEAERLVRRAVAIDRADRRKAGDPDPDNAAYLDSLAWVLFRREKLAEARTLLLKVSALPDGAADGTVWDHLGDVEFRLDNPAAAKAAWDRAAALLAGDPRGTRDDRLDDVKRKSKRVP